MERQALIASHRAGYAALDFRYDETWRHVGESLRLAQRVDAHWTTTFAHVMGARLALYFGEPERAQTHLDAADRLMEGTGDHSLTADILGLRAAVAARQDNPELARATLQRLATSKVPGVTYQLHRASLAVTEHRGFTPGGIPWLQWMALAFGVSALVAAAYVAGARGVALPGPVGAAARPPDAPTPDAPTPDAHSSDAPARGTVAARDAGSGPGAVRDVAPPPRRSVPAWSVRRAPGGPVFDAETDVPRVRVARDLTLAPALDSSTAHPEPLVASRTDDGLLVAEVPLYTRSGMMAGVREVPATTLRRHVGRGLVLLNEGQGRMRLLAIRRMQGHEIVRGFGGEIRPERVDAVVRGLVMATFDLEVRDGGLQVPGDGGTVLRGGRLDGGTARDGASGDGHGAYPPPTLAVNPFDAPTIDASASASGDRDAARGWNRPGAVATHVADLFGLARSARGDWVDLPLITYAAAPQGVVRLPWRLVEPILSRSLIVLKRDLGGQPLVAVSHQGSYEVVNRVGGDVFRDADALRGRVDRVRVSGDRPSPGATGASGASGPTGEAGVSLAPTEHPVRGVVMAERLPDPTASRRAGATWGDRSGPARSDDAPTDDAPAHASGDAESGASGDARGDAPPPRTVLQERLVDQLQVQAPDLVVLSDLTFERDGREVPLDVAAFWTDTQLHETGDVHLSSQEPLVAVLLTPPGSGPGALREAALWLLEAGAARTCWVLSPATRSACVYGDPTAASPPFAPAPQRRLLRDPAAGLTVDLDALFDPAA